MATKEIAANIKSIEAIKPGAERVTYNLRGERGLSLVVQPTGKATWQFRYVLGRGREGRKFRTEQLGVYMPGKGEPVVMMLAMAMLERATAMAKVLSGNDPFPPPVIEAPAAVATVDDLFAHWLEHHAKVHLRSWPKDLERYDRHIRPRLGSRALATIRRADFRALETAIVDTGSPVEAATIVTLLNRLLNHGVHEELIDANPGAGYRKQTAPRRRELHLGEDDLRKLWQGLCEPVVSGAATLITHRDARNVAMTRLALRLVIVLGQRETEVAGLPVAELHGLDTLFPLWRLPGERTKNKLPHQLPLPPLAVSIIREAMALGSDTKGKGSAFVFANEQTGIAMEGPALRKAMQRMCTRLGITGDGGRPGQRPSPHDLRRTVGTLMRECGVDVEGRGHVFNHIGGAKSKVTSWNYDAGEHNREKLAALMKWEARLKAIVEGGGAGSNVVPLRA